MARAPKVVEETEPAVEPVTETITYLPGEGDKASVLWGGHTFHANVPKEITGHAEGTAAQKLNLHLIERARENRLFAVGDGKPKRQAATVPATAEQYRAYLVDWLKDPSIQHADQLIARFAKDRELQADCEVGSDDYAYIATLFMPKLHELARIDELSDAQLAAIWISHGFNQTPW